MGTVYRRIVRDWVRGFGNYLHRVGDALSQLGNVVIFLGDNPNESISGRSWRLRRRWFWGIMRVAIDALASPFESDHCQKSHEADVARAAKLLRQQGI